MATTHTKKIPPHDHTAEQSLLGALMIDKVAVTKVADMLSAQEFYDSAHQKIYDAILSLFMKSEPIDVVSVTSKLTARKQLGDIGGSTYLTELVDAVPSAAHIAHYAKIIREKRVLRDLISVAADIEDIAFDPGENTEHILDGIEKRIFSLAQKSQDKRFSAIKDELHSAYERIEKLHEGDGTALRGVTSGFSGIDGYLSGFQRSDLIILGARPSLGKTTLALDFCRHASQKGNVPVGIFSLEMSKEQIIDRFISSEAGVPLWKLRTGRLNSDLDFELIQGALDRLSGAQIYIDDTPALNVMQIRSLARRLQMEHGLGLLVIDYVQLIHPIGRTDNMVQQFTEISHGLKALSRELDIPVIALSQLNRSVDQRESHIPKLSDLRETGSWEQDADVVMLIYRKDRSRTGMEPSLEDENTASIIIAKHRNGPIGTVDLKFDPERVTFREIDTRHDESLE